MDYDEIMCLVRNEVLTAKEKHPLWPHDIIHQAAIVGEEAGELIQATVQHVYEGGDVHNIQTEAVHTIATCVRLLEAME